MNNFVVILAELVNKAKYITDHYIDYELPSEYYGSRKVIFEKLKNDGYVTKVEYYGKNFVRCQVMDKAFELILEEE